ncbi:MAG: YfhO family protein [Oscillospiraceae bacterium]|nr:YfhO family protein [Oscillospiraceae bacterium]MDD4368310.1 YfhO family protein [Oscillospiraceae bacterium]
MSAKKKVKKPGIMPARVQPEARGIQEVKARLKTPAPRQPLRSGSILFLAFLFPLLILATAYAIQGFYPVADTSPLTIDLYHQYAPFLEELRDKLLGGQSLLYSWNGGLGVNFYALIAYYLASPLNLLMLLFPADYLSEAVTVLTLLKVGLIGFTFAFMLRGAFCPYANRTVGAKPAGRSSRLDEIATDWAIIIFATAFALSGFILAYSWDIMWLDAIVALPLVILGMTRLVRDGRFALYTLALAYTIYVNYYIALFVCLFTGLYFFSYYFTAAPDLPEARLRPWRHFFKRLLQFVFFSLLGAALATFMALPTYLALQNTSATNDKFPQTWSITFNIFAFISRNLPAMQPAIRDGLPNIYVGLPVFILLPLYLSCRRIRLSEKLWHLGLLAFIYISFASNGLNFLWHGMHYPNQLPYRYAFVFSFLLLIIGFRAFTYVREMKPAVLAFGAGSGILYVILAEQFLSETVDHTTVFASLLFLAVYAAVFSLLRNRRYSFRSVVTIFTVVFMAEILFNTVITTWAINENEHYTSRSSFNGDFSSVRSEIAAIEDSDATFYRMELIQQKTTNSPALYNYPGFTLFASTSYEETAKLMRNLGYHSNNINSYKYTGSTAVMNSIFGLKYLINKTEAIQDPLLQNIPSSNGLYTYLNPYALSVGFLTDDNLLNWNTESGSPFELQNNFVKLSGATTKDVLDSRELETEELTNYNATSSSAVNGYAFDPVDSGQAGTVTLTMTVQQAEHLYFYIEANATTTVEVTVTAADQSQLAAGESKTEAETVLTPALGEENETEAVSTSFYDSRDINKPETFDAGYCEAGSTVRLTLKASEGNAQSLRVYAAALNESVYTQAFEKLAQGNLEISDYTADSLTGTVTAQDSSLLFLSIPYDSSWQVTVDGKTATLLDVGDGLSGVALQAGTHQISLKFIPDGLPQGLIISGAALLLLLLLLLLSRLTASRRRERQRRLVQELENRELNYRQAVVKAAAALNGSGSLADMTASDLWDRAPQTPDQPAADLNPGDQPAKRTPDKTLPPAAQPAASPAVPPATAAADQAFRPQSQAASPPAARGEPPVPSANDSGRSAENDSGQSAESAKNEANGQKNE